MLEDLPSLFRHGGKSSDGSPDVVLERLEDAFQSILLLHTLKPEKTGAKLSSSQIPSVVIKIVWVCAEQAS